MGLGFIHPAFLAAAAAVAVPIVIHLLFRRQARRVEIGTLRFLQAVIRDQARRRRIRHWVLLALPGRRAPARPPVRAAVQGSGKPGSAREVVMLIDRSASMGAGPRGPRRWTRPGGRRASSSAALPDGTAVRLAYFDAEGVVPVQEPRIDPAIRPGLAGTDYTKALGWAHDIVVASRRSSGRSCS